MTIQFTIYGNHANSTGNPIPKARLTFRQRWTDKAESYTRWKNHVRGAYLSAMNIWGHQIIVDDDLHPRKPRFEDSKGKELKPIRIKYARAHMQLKIYWKDNTHGDPENIFGSIADALFASDKNLDGSFESCLAHDRRGRVEVSITLCK